MENFGKSFKPRLILYIILRTSAKISDAEPRRPAKQAKAISTLPIICQP